MKSVHVTLVLAIFAALALPTAVLAQNPFNNFYYGWNYGFQGGMPIYAPTYNNHVVPYYSQHPPVYYSPTIVRRSYGTSPFPLPPNSQPVAAYPSESQSAATVSASAPQFIINPFVDGAAEWSPPSTAGSVKEALSKAGETLPAPAAPVMRVLPPSPPQQ